MATYNVEELEKVAAELNARLATAKDMAEQEEAARTLISAPKKVITSARARSRSWGSEAVDMWAREEVGAARCLVYLRHAGLDPTQERDRNEAAEEREERKQVEAAVARLVLCVERGSLPGLRRVGEARTARMGRLLWNPKNVT